MRTLSTKQKLVGGAAAVGIGDSAVELTQIGRPTTLAPGATSLVRVNVRNLSSGPLHFGTVKIDVPSTFSAQADPAYPACTSADVMAGSYDVNDTYAADGGPLVQVGPVMNDPTTDQRNCKGLSIPLDLAMS